jgi:cyclophilin family peptidyl-prolyl cis-trans isomerase
VTNAVISYRNEDSTAKTPSTITRLAAIAIAASFMFLLSGCAARSILPAFSPTQTRVGGPQCDLSTHICDKPAMTLDPTQDYSATIKTAKGDIVIHLDAKNSPQTVNNFIYLAQQRYYDGTYFWRVEIPGQPSPLDPTGQPSELALIQGGSVQDDGDPGKNYPGYTIPDELTTARSAGYKSGTIAMANTGQPDSGAAQFFINTGDNTDYFNPAYAVFGLVTSGLDVARKIESKEKIESITITVTSLATPTASEITTG